MFEQLVLEECGALVLRGVEEGEVLEPHPAVTLSSHRVRCCFLIMSLLYSPATAAPQIITAALCANDDFSNELAAGLRALPTQQQCCTGSTAPYCTLRALLLKSCVPPAADRTLLRARPAQAAQFTMVVLRVEDEVGRRVCDNDLLLLSKVSCRGGSWGLA